MPGAGVTIWKERVKEEFHPAGRFYESFSKMVGDLLSQNWLLERSQITLPCSHWLGTATKSVATGVASQGG